MAWNANDLLRQVKLRGQFPDTNGAITDEEMLLLADEAMFMDIFSLILSCKREYYVKDADVDIVDNQQDYIIPSRAAGTKLRDLLVLNPNGNPVTEQSVLEIVPEQAWRYQVSNSVWWNTAGAYYWKGQSVCLLPKPTAANGFRLRFRYYLRRPRMTLTYGHVSAINTGTGEITFDAARPSVFTVGAEVDLIQAKPYFDALSMNVPITAVDTNSITVDPADISDNFVVGDYVCLEDTSYLMPCPVELQPLLVSATLVKVLEALGDPKLETTAALFERDRQRMMDYLSPRNEGESPRIINRSSPTRANRGWWGY